MKYTVSRTLIITEYCDEIEAESEEKALEIAQQLGEECWEQDDNCEYNYYDYNVEPIE